jgi:hypothetical protein
MNAPTQYTYRRASNAGGGFNYFNVVKQEVNYLLTCWGPDYDGFVKVPVHEVWAQEVYEMAKEDGTLSVPSIVYSLHNVL